MADSANANTDGPVRVTLTVNGSLQASIQLISITIRQALNKIPWAEIVLDDGDMPTKSFALSDAATYAPGATLSVQAGYGDASTTVFSGVIMRHSIRITNDNFSRLIVECRDAAVKMTIGRVNANFLNQKDSDIISTLISAHGLTANVKSTSTQFPELVQYYCNDWDFMLSRADLNGLLVNVDAGTVNVQPPNVSASAVLSLTWGVDLHAFNAEIDARYQFTAAQATGWDPKSQAISQGSSAAPASLNSQGNLDSATLAKVASPSTFNLQTSTNIPQDALGSWATAVQQKAGLARIRGRMTFQGNASAKPGVLIQVQGVGARFNGSVFVSAVQHSISNGNWITEVEFGLRPEWHTERDDVVAPLAAGLLPGISGLHIGVVLKLDGDPQGEQRIQVKVPVLQAQTEGIWARLLQFHASNTFGAFFLPEVGDEVLLGFLNADPSSPVVLGSFYSSARTPPYALAADNDTKAIVTRCQHKFIFDEKDKIITIVTPGSNTIVLSDKDKSILVQDQNSNSVKLSSSGIDIESASDIKINAKGGITMSAVNAINITAQADFKAAGMNVNCEAQVGFTGKGAATAELSASGQTTVKGAMVMIN